MTGLEVTAISEVTIITSWQSAFNQLLSFKPSQITLHLIPPNRDLARPRVINNSGGEPEAPVHGQSWVMVVLTLDQLKRAWTGIVTMLGMTSMYLYQRSHDVTTVTSKHEPFSQCWYNVGQASKTMGQHYANIGWTARVCWDSPENMMHWPNAGAMLVPTIKQNCFMSFPGK